ncbi:OLC1v1028418C1 [Oldenlandia corymbosa var. corymbosa]|uniref:OLC1v1028418C1 n=1 Tax=Oldenlandia corymbosa var. corymbosa TaxID=529605 RepID=A0AAV1CCE8_OLDCO|nr:OLC1v1028418C1 [Oldenlandia corymbosa var. corymbosa]
MVGPSMISSYNSLTLKSSTSSSTLKFLCSYGGKILPRYPDGKLRYHGGQTRVLAVHRSISFSELVRKLGEMCGTLTVSLRCQLPTEDMDALVSITSDEDLANLIEEYDRAALASPPTTSSSSLKVRAFLSTPKSKLSPTSSLASSSSSSSSTSDSTPTIIYPKSSSSCMSTKPPKGPKCVHQNQITSRPVAVMGYPCQYGPSSTAKGLPHYGPAGKVSSPIYLIHHGNHWQ